MLRRRPAPANGNGVLDLPGYSDLTVIGTGSSGIVYRAYQPRLDRVVAIKVVLADLSGGDLRARWERECRATGRLSRHPHIVTVLDAGVSPAGRPYLVMDWYPQGSLAGALQARGPMPVFEVLSLGVKLCGALETAHRTGILHRDVKPENVLLDELGEPALADFGIAGVAGTATAQLGPRALTPVYAAPEVLNDRPASPASDIYALGSVLYTALAGRAAYEAGLVEGFAALLTRVLYQPVPPLERADLPAAVEEVVRWAMEKDPAARPGSAAALGQRLQQIQVQQGEPPTDLVITATVGAEAKVPTIPTRTGRLTALPEGTGSGSAGAPSETNEANQPRGVTVSRPPRRDQDAPPPGQQTTGQQTTGQQTTGQQTTRQQTTGQETPGQSAPGPKAPAPTPPATNSVTGPPPPAFSGPVSTGTVARPSRSGRGRHVEVPPAPETPPERRRPWLWAVPAVVGVGAAVIGVVVANAIGGGPAPPPPTTVAVDQALAPTDLRVTVLGHESVQLHWRDHAHGLYPYVVLYEPPLPNGHASDATARGATSYLVTGLRASQRTCFRVALANGPEAGWPTSQQVCTSP